MGPTEWCSYLLLPSLSLKSPVYVNIYYRCPADFHTWVPERAIMSILMSYQILACLLFNIQPQKHKALPSVVLFSVIVVVNPPPLSQCTLSCTMYLLCHVVKMFFTLLMCLNTVLHSRAVAIATVQPLSDPLKVEV